MEHGNDGELRSIAPATVEVGDEPIEHVNALDEKVEATTPAPSCRGNQLDIGTHAGVEPVCLGMLVTKYNGSVRLHQVATLATPQRWLRVEVAGSTILSAAW